MIKMSTYHKAKVLMMCGDLTGKAIIPIVKSGKEEWYCSPWGHQERMHSEREVQDMMKKIRNQGYYPYVTTEEELDELKNNRNKVSELFVRLIKESMKRWLNMVETLVPKDVLVIVNPGNDDIPEIDEIIKNNQRVIYPLHQVVDLDSRHQMISCEWVNPTPWKTPRECPEEELAKKLEDEFKRVSDYKNLVCNFHAPPFNTHLDLAPKLDKNLKPVTRFGNPVSVHVGSVAVREVIEKYQPLLGLHGHIHESGGLDHIGRTLCLNPGSEYQSVLLKGWLVDLPRKETERLNCWRVEA